VVLCCVQISLKNFMHYNSVISLASFLHHVYINLMLRHILLSQPFTRNVLHLVQNLITYDHIIYDHLIIDDLVSLQNSFHSILLQNCNFLNLQVDGDFTEWARSNFAVFVSGPFFLYSKIYLRMICCRVCWKFIRQKMHTASLSLRV